jgi:hypothetical protein
VKVLKYIAGFIKSITHEGAENKTTASTAQDWQLY